MSTPAPLTPAQRRILQFLKDAQDRGLDVVSVPDPDGSGRAVLHAVDPEHPDRWPSHVRDYVVAALAAQPTEVPA